MNFSEILNELEQVSPFELYRIMIMIRQQLESPENILKIKRHLKPGQEIAYFDETENRLIEAKVIKLNRTRLLVENEHDGVKWNIPYYYVNIDNIDPMIRNSHVKEGVDNRASIGSV